jgi:hypothetical protein
MLNSSLDEGKKSGSEWLCSCLISRRQSSEFRSARCNLLSSKPLGLTDGSSCNNGKHAEQRTPTTEKLHGTNKILSANFRISTCFALAFITNLIILFIILSIVTFSTLGSVYICFGHSGWTFLSNYTNMENNKMSDTHFSKKNDNGGHLRVTWLLLKWNVSKFKTLLEWDLHPIRNRSCDGNIWLNPVNISPNKFQRFEAEWEMKLKSKFFFLTPWR